jgi:oxygen-dependent protoporphyrinogen oxidase
MRPGATGFVRPVEASESDENDIVGKFCGVRLDQARRPPRERRGAVGGSGQGAQLELDVEPREAPEIDLALDPTVGLCGAERKGAERLGRSPPTPRGAYVYGRGALRRLPAGLSALMPTRLAPLATSGILSLAGLLRVTIEPLQRVRTDAGDESVEAFVVRRLGREAYERLVEPLLTGIYAGDGARLSLAATFPQLRAMELEHGSLLRGARSRARGDGGEPGSPFLSLPTGMEELIEALAAALRATGRVDFRLGTPARALRPAREFGGGDGVLVWPHDGDPVRCDAVVVAAPAPEAAALLEAVDPTLARELASIEHGSAAAVTLAYPAESVPRPLDATGYVVPGAEREGGVGRARPVLACTWASSKLPGRAPAGAALLRLFLGGARRPDVVELDDDALVALARTELRDVLGVAAEPTLVRVTRWRRAMPQYHLGHVARVERIERRAGAVPWLALAGNAYRGVGIPDCVRSGERAAERVLAGLGAARRAGLGSPSARRDISPVAADETVAPGPE